MGKDDSFLDVIPFQLLSTPLQQASNLPSNLPKGLSWSISHAGGLKNVYLVAALRNQPETLLKASVQISEELIFHRFYMIILWFSSSISICLSKKFYHHWYDFRELPIQPEEKHWNCASWAPGVLKNRTPRFEEEGFKREKCLLIWVFPKIGVKPPKWMGFF